jgi:lipoprotein-releasing system permease protein
MRQLRLILRTAAVYLSGRRRQTILVTAGVAVGAMVMIVTFALTNGIIESIKEKIVNVSPHITLKGEKVRGKERILMGGSPFSTDHFFMASRIIPDEKKEVRPSTAVISLLETVNGVDAVAPFVQTQGVLRKAKLFRQVLIKGVIPAREASIGNLMRNIVSGTLAELAFTPDGVLIGAGLARKINASYRDLLRLTAENGKVYTLVVTGIFASGFGAADDNNAYVNLPLAQAIKGFQTNVVSGIGIHTTDVSRVEPLAREIERLTGYQAETWQEANENLLTVFTRNNNITLLLVVFVFIVSGFGVSNVLITIVLQKQKDIAVMKSVGFSIRSIEGIFLAQGLMIGLIGTVLGLIGGHEMARLIESLPISFGEEAVVRVKSITVLETPLSYVVTACFSVVVSALASYSPARRAARLRPIEILRA